jgi:NADPH-dependent 2,4-dienoyl-CoA reductase/sulfur reductase-like enzyme
MAERLVVIGGDAGGMSAASQARRMRPADDLEIVAFERGPRTSYAACGIPYRVAGLVGDGDALVARRPEQFRQRQQIDARIHHEVTAIDLADRTVEVRDLDAGETRIEGFDTLLIGTGARPIRPPLPGIDLPFVFTVHTLDDAEALLARATEGISRAVVVGGGFIGLEMAEAFVLQGIAVTLVEATDQVMRTLDADMAEPVAASLRAAGVDLRIGSAVEGFEPGRVLTAVGPIDADLVVLGIGLQPNGELAGAAGLELGERGAIRVDDHQRAADGVYAVGDCTESRHLVTGTPVYVALGTMANRQGRVAGINIGGGDATFPGVLGSAVTRFCETEIGHTGLNEVAAAAAGLDVVAGRIEATVRPHYYPGADPVTVKLVAERATGRLVGGQIVGGAGAAKRIDVVATAITAGMTAADLAETDLSYAPPFSPVWDPVLIAARHTDRARG